MRDTDKQLLELLSLRAAAGYSTPAECFTNLHRSVNAGQVHVICNDHQRPVGYIAWAELSKETFSRLLTEGVLPLYAYGWKEGKLIAIVEVSLKKHYGCLLRAALRSIFGRRRVIAFLRRGRLSVYLQRDGKFGLLLRHSCGRSGGLPAHSSPS